MSIDACAKLVQAADPDRFASAMCAPMPGREALMVLYAFNVEVSRAPWVTQEEIIAEMRLQWWKDAIAEIYEGQSVRSHEVVSPLADVIGEAELPRDLFDGLIEARRFDIYRDRHETDDAFDAYVAATSGNLMELAGRSLGATEFGAFREFGWASGLANLLMALPQLYERGRSPLPSDKVDRNTLLEGRLDAGTSELIRGLSMRGLQVIERARKAAHQRAVQPALLAGWRAKSVLTKISRDPERALSFPEAGSLERSSTLLLRSLTGRWA